jgi:hypothetical protein
MRQTVRRSWTLPEHADAREWERLVREAATHGLVSSWDDGRGRVPWYTARRCKAERALCFACVLAVNVQPTTELELP